MSVIFSEEVEVLTNLVQKREIVDSMENLNEVKSGDKVLGKM